MLGGDGMITFGADGQQVVLTDYGGEPVRSKNPDFFWIYATKKNHIKKSVPTIT